MTTEKTIKPRARYGTEGSPLIYASLVAGTLLLVLAVVLKLPLLTVLGTAALLVAVFLLVTASYGTLIERDKMLALAQIAPGSTVLDYHTGRGLFGIEAAKRLDAGVVYLVLDKSLENGEANTGDFLQNNIAAEEVSGKVIVVEKDGARIPVDSASVDRVISYGTLHKLSDRSARSSTIAEMARVLKPDGRVIVHVPAAATVEAAALLRAAGFKDVQQSGIRLAVFPPGSILTASR